jgi:hypothetical protein
MPPPVGLGVGFGVPVGVGVGEGVVIHGFFREQQLPSGRVPWWQVRGAGEGDDVAVAVGEGEGLAAAATPEAPASMSANTPGSKAIAVRPLRRRRGVSSVVTFALIDVFQLWS